MIDWPLILIAGIAGAAAAVALVLLRRRSEVRLSGAPPAALLPPEPQVAAEGPAESPAEPMFGAQGSRLVVRHPLVLRTALRALEKRPVVSRYLSHDGQQVAIDVEALPFRDESERERAREILARLEAGEGEPDLADLLWVAQLIGSD